MELNKVYCGDCLKVLKTFPDACIDLTVTSPPYDNLRTYHGYIFDFEGIAKELHRVTKTGGVLVWIVGDATINGSETGTSFRQALYFKNIGFNLHDTMIYRKTNPIPLSHNRYEQCFEFMFVFSKGRPKTFNPILEECKFAGKDIVSKRTFYQTSDDNTSAGHKNESVGKTKIKQNIFEYPLHGGKKKIRHPAAFPEQLAHDHIVSWSNIGDVVLDPMAGCGTTLRIARLNNRNYIGVEISQEYCDIIIKKLRNIPISLF